MENKLPSSITVNVRDSSTPERNMVSVCSKKHYGNVSNEQIIAIEIFTVAVLGGFMPKEEVSKWASVKNLKKLFKVSKK